MIVMATISVTLLAVIFWLLYEKSQEAKTIHPPLPQGAKFKLGYTMTDGRQLGTIEYMNGKKESAIKRLNGAYRIFKEGEKVYDYDSTSSSCVPNFEVPAAYIAKPYNANVPGWIKADTPEPGESVMYIQESNLANK